jgi:hypothetical protein
VLTAPLLPIGSCSNISLGRAVQPIDKILKRRGATFVPGYVTGIDFANKQCVPPSFCKVDSCSMGADCLLIVTLPEVLRSIIFQ